MKRDHMRHYDKEWDDRQMRRLLTMKKDGASNEDIARSLGRSVSTVKQKLAKMAREKREQEAQRA